MIVVIDEGGTPPVYVQSHCDEEVAMIRSLVAMPGPRAGARVIACTAGNWLDGVGMMTSQELVGTWLKNSRPDLPGYAEWYADFAEKWRAIRRGDVPWFAAEPKPYLPSSASTSITR